MNFVSKIVYLVAAIFDVVWGQCPTNNRPMVESSVSHKLTNSISFVFFPPGTSSFSNATTYSFGCSCQILDHPKFNKKLETYFFQHGYTENCTASNPKESCILVREAFAKYTKSNLILISYAHLVDRRNKIDFVDYPRSVLNIKHIGSALCKFFECFYQHCSCQKNATVIGFSLGAQLIHYTFKSCTAKLEHGIGCDPAGPLYLENESLNKNDGTFIQAIHTNPGAKLTNEGPYGNTFNLATVDFWFNFYNKPVQPICTTNQQLLEFYYGSLNLCSHYMCMRYLLKTLQNPKIYKGSECNNISPNVANPGFGINKNQSGIFCVDSSIYYV